MDPNRIGITRVWVREIGQLIMDDTLRNNIPAGNEIVVEYEAGATINGTGANVNIEIVVWDWTNNAQLGRWFIGPFALAGGNEPRTYQQTQALPIPIIAAAPPAMCKVTTGLIVRVAPGPPALHVVSLYEGPMFYVVV